METNNNKNDLVAEAKEKLNKGVDTLIENMLAGKYEVYDKSVELDYSERPLACTLLRFSLLKKPKKLFHLTFGSKRFLNESGCKLFLKEVEIEGQPAEKIYCELSEETFARVGRFFNEVRTVGDALRVVNLVDNLNRQVETINSVL